MSQGCEQSCSMRLMIFTWWYSVRLGGTVSDYHIQVDQTSVIHHLCSQDHKEEGCKPYLGKLNSSHCFPALLPW